MSCHPDTKEPSLSMSSAEENQQNVLDLGTPSSGSCHHVSPAARDNEEIQPSSLDLSTTNSRLCPPQPTVENQRYAAENQNKLYSQVESRMATSSSIPVIDRRGESEDLLYAEEKQKMLFTPFESRKEMSSSNPTSTIQARKLAFSPAEIPIDVSRNSEPNVKESSFSSINRRGESEDLLYAEEKQKMTFTPFESRKEMSSSNPTSTIESRKLAFSPAEIPIYVSRNSEPNVTESSFSSIDRRGESEDLLYAEDKQYMISTPVESRMAISSSNTTNTLTAINLFYPSDNIPKYVPHSYEPCMTEAILNPIDNLRKMESQLNSKESHETFSNPFKSEKSRSNPTGSFRAKKSQLPTKIPYYVGHSSERNVTKPILRSVHRRGKSENQLHSEEIQKPLSSPVESTMAVSNLSPIHPFEARNLAFVPQNIHEYVRRSSAQNMTDSSFSSIDRRLGSEDLLYAEEKQKMTFTPFESRKEMSSSNPTSTIQARKLAFSPAEIPIDVSRNSEPNQLHSEEIQKTLSSVESTMAVSNFNTNKPLGQRKLAVTPQNIQVHSVMSFESCIRESNCSSIYRYGGSENILHAEEIQEQFSDTFESRIAMALLSPTGTSVAANRSLSPAESSTFPKPTGARKLSIRRSKSVDSILALSNFKPPDAPERRKISSGNEIPLSIISLIQFKKGPSSLTPPSASGVRKRSLSPLGDETNSPQSVQLSIGVLNTSPSESRGGSESPLSPAESSTSSNVTGAGKRRSTRTRSNRSLLESVESSVTSSNLKPRDSPERSEFSSGYEIPFSITSPIEFKKGASSMTPPRTSLETNSSLSPAESLTSPKATGARKRRSTPTRSNRSLFKSVDSILALSNLKPRDSPEKSEFSSGYEIPLSIKRPPSASGVRKRSLSPLGNETNPPQTVKFCMDVLNMSPSESCGASESPLSPAESSTSTITIGSTESTSTTTRSEEGLSN